MDPIQRGGLVFLEEPRGTHVRGDHRLFDQPVRVVAHHRLDAFEQTVLENQLLFRRIEIERAAFFARGEQAL